MDKSKIDRFWQARTHIDNARLATNYRDDGRLDIDCDFVRRFLGPKPKLLDLGAGTCTLALKLLPFCQQVTAVEKFQGFLDRVPQCDVMTKVCEDVVSYRSNKKFDVIVLFGVVNFLTPDEEREVYKNCRSMLEPGGSFLVKNQCGQEKEIVVDKHSEELQTHYHARYPWVEEQQRSLSVFFETHVVDIYPAHINRWQETHFYGFVCS